MIVTVTANTAIDHITFIKEWQFDQTLRAQDTLQSIAGKPTDASWILAEMGIESLALGFKAGMTGETVQHMLTEKGVQTDFISVDGESRRNLVIVMETEQQQTTITSSTLQVTSAHIQQLEAKYLDALDSSTCVVTGGTLPSGMSPTFYKDMIQLARERDIPVILDASGVFLKEGIKGQPTYIKPNRDELANLVEFPIHTIDDAYRAGCSVRDEFGTYPIISLGADGGLAILEDEAYRIYPLDVNVVSTAGAGDGVLAGLAAAVGRHQPIMEGNPIGLCRRNRRCHATRDSPMPCC